MVLLGILILVPLCVALLLLLGMLLGLAKGEGGVDSVIGATFFAGLCGVLVWAARRMLTRDGSLLAVPGVAAADTGLQRFLTSYVLILVYLVLAGYAFVILHINSMRNWLGVVLLVLAAATLESALGQARRSRHEHSENASPGGRGPTMKDSSINAPGMTRRDHIGLLTAVAGFSVSAVLYYCYWGGNRHLGPVDLIGFLALAVTLTIATILRRSTQRGSMRTPQANLIFHQEPKSPTGE